MKLFKCESKFSFNIQCYTIIQPAEAQIEIN